MTMEKGLTSTGREVYSKKLAYSRAFKGGRSLRIRTQQWCPHAVDSGTLVKTSYSKSRNSTRNIASISDGELWLSRNAARNFGIIDAPARTFPRIGYILDAYEDEYKGVVVNPERLPWNASDFVFSLRASLSHWKSTGKKGVWLKLPIEQSELVPFAVKVGFKYHHAEEEYVMLTYWLSEGPNLLPANASHLVGVGGFVINDKNEVLVIQEKYSVLASTDDWKIPTGFINENEEIFDGAVREVKEETGVDTEFVEVIAFRHAHTVAFKKSDLFFVCMLKPLSTQIQIDKLEIQAAKWMPLVEFVKQPFIWDDDMFKKVISICIEKLKQCYCGLSAHPVISKFDGKPSSLYYNVSGHEGFNCQGS